MSSKLRMPNDGVVGTSQVFAVVGMSGSGKTEVVSALARLTGARTVYLGGVVIEEIERRGRKVTEESEAEVRMELRQAHGMEAMAVLRLPQILDAIAGGLPVVVDGLYSYSEYCFLKENLGPRLLVVAVHAPFWLRVQRLRDRPIRPLTVEEVRTRDKREVETMEKGGPIAIADFHILNDGSVSEISNSIAARVLGQLKRHTQLIEG